MAAGSVNLVELLRRADPISRREFLKRTAGTPLAATILGAFLAACQPAAPSEPRPAGPEGQPRRGGTFVTLGHHDVDSLSPEDAGPLVHYVVVGNIHEGLLKVDENYNLVPRLAESYEVSPDGLVYTFRLRRGVKWHDGRDFTSADVKYNIEWVMNPDNASIRRPLFADVERVETPDPYTVVVRLKQPNAPFLILAMTTELVPKHYHEQVGEKAYKQRPVGTGPYKFKEQQVGKYVLLEANENYWGGRPHIDFFKEELVPEPSVRAVALETGKADSSTWQLAPEDTLRFMNHPNFQHLRAPSTAVNHFVINNRRPYFQDKRVRQAMMYAVDRDAMVKDLFKGLAVKATANISPAVKQYYEPDVKQYPYDPARARALLAEAGWRPGPDGILVNDRGERFSVVCDILVGDALRRTQAEMAQRNWREVGIEVRLNELEAAAVLSKGRRGDHDMQLFNWTYGGGSGEPDARVGLSCEGLNNFSKWCNREAERLLEEGVKTVDPEKRRKIYSELQKLVAEEVPFLFMTFWEWVVIISKRVKGLPKSAANPTAVYTANFHKYWIEE